MRDEHHVGVDLKGPLLQMFGREMRRRGADPALLGRGKGSKASSVLREILTHYLEMRENEESELPPEWQHFAGLLTQGLARAEDTSPGISDTILTLTRAAQASPAFAQVLRDLARLVFPESVEELRALGRTTTEGR